jgi:hypothetical protein
MYIDNTHIFTDKQPESSGKYLSLKELQSGDFGESEINVQIEMVVCICVIIIKFLFYRL